MSENNIETANGLLILFYKRSEEKAITPQILKKMLENAILPVICDDPANFRFVRPETFVGHKLDAVGRAALSVLGEYNSEEKFVKLLRADLLKENKPS